MNELNKYGEITFTIKRDFKLTNFLIKCKPKYMFKTTHVGGVDFEQINTNSNVTLKEIDVANLIKSKNTVIVLYEAEHKMDCYNFEDESKLLSMVITY